MEEIVLATAKAMVSEGIPFRGVLFAGLMIKNGKASHELINVHAQSTWWQFLRIKTPTTCRAAQ
jgi:hypothetical protein